MVTEVLPTLVPDGFIYLRAEPETCKQRMTLRARSEEGGVELTYLKELHDLHEDWLRKSVSARPDGLCSPDPVLSRDLDSPGCTTGRVMQLGLPTRHWWPALRFRSSR